MRMIIQDILTKYPPYVVKGKIYQKLQKETPSLSDSKLERLTNKKAKGLFAKCYSTSAASVTIKTVLELCKLININPDLVVRTPKATLRVSLQPGCVKNLISTILKMEGVTSRIELRNLLMKQSGVKPSGLTHQALQAITNEVGLIMSSDSVKTLRRLERLIPVSITLENY